MQPHRHLLSSRLALSRGKRHHTASRGARVRLQPLVVAAVATLAGSSTGTAALLNWDADGVTPISGGTGVWNTTTPLWVNGVGDYVNWTNVPADDATLGGTAGTVTLGEAINVGTLTVNTTNYTVDLNGFALTVGAVAGTAGLQSNTTITNLNAATVATFATGNLANSGPRLSGNMNVVFNSATITTWSPALTNDFTGVLTLQGLGTVIATENRNIGSASGLIRVEGSKNLFFSGPTIGHAETFTRNIELIGTAVGLGVNGARGAVLTGVISGTDGLRVTSGQGSLILAGANTFSGPVTFTSQNSLLIAAHNQAFGAATSITVPSGGQASTVGFRRDLNGNDINVGATTPIILTGSATNSGYGMIHNFEGNNRFAGNVTLGSNQTRTISSAKNSTLTLTGVIGGGKGLTKIGDGTVVITGQNIYGTANAVVGNETAVNAGVLRLDFSQAAVGHDVDIVNFQNASNGNSSSGLTLGGGTLEIKGRPEAVNSQRFKNNAGAGNGFTVNPGASAIRIAQNGAINVSLDVGQIAARNIGGTVDLTLPTSGAITSAPGALQTVGAAGLVIANGAAFMTVDGVEWAARNAANALVAGSTMPDFYTPTFGGVVQGNSQVVPGETTLTTSATADSVRFHQSDSAAINLNGHSLATGGILVTNVGNAASLILGGTLMAAAGTANQDLVVVQNNTAAETLITSMIADNSTPSALTKSGPGTLAISGANTYTGTTTVNEGVLRLDNGLALGSGNLALKGGVVGLTEESGDFTRALGTGAGQVQYLGSGGFAAYGGDRAVTFANNAELRLGRQDGQTPMFHVAGLNALIFSAPDADGMLIFNNPIRIGAYSGPQEWEFRVHNGQSLVDARLNGIIRSDGGLTKTGAGTLELAAANTYLGPTTINEGTVIVTGSIHTDSRFSIHNSSTLRLAANGPVAGHHITMTSGTLSIDGVNETAKSLALGGGAANSESTIITGTGVLTLSGNVTYSGNVANDKGATITGNLNLGNATRVFSVQDSTATTNDLVVSGEIAGGAGLIKDGAGSMQLLGNNSYTGPTTINQGVLGVFGSLSGSSNVLVNGGTLSGTGGIGQVTLSSGTIAPGSSPGTLNTGNLILNGGGLVIEIVDGLSFDTINVAGSVHFGGPVNLTLSVSEEFAMGTSFSIIENNLDDPVTFTDALSLLVLDGNPLQEGEIFAVSGAFGVQAFEISYAGGFDGNDVVLTAVPEPGAATMLLAGLGCLAGYRRRKS